MLRMTLIALALVSITIPADAARQSLYPPDGAYTASDNFAGSANGITEVIVQSQPTGFKTLDYKQNGQWHRLHWDPILDCWTGPNKKFYITPGSTTHPYQFVMMVPGPGDSWTSSVGWGGAIGSLQ